MTKFTPEYIAKCRKAMGGVWWFPEARTALDEIEKLRFMIARLIVVGNWLGDPDGGVALGALDTWKALANEWQEMK